MVEVALALSPQVLQVQVDADAEQVFQILICDFGDFVPDPALVLVDAGEELDGVGDFELIAFDLADDELEGLGGVLFVVIVEAEGADHAFVFAGVIEAEVGDGFGFVGRTLVVVQILFHLIFD